MEHTVDREVILVPGTVAREGTIQRVCGDKHVGVEVLPPMHASSIASKMARIKGMNNDVEGSDVVGTLLALGYNFDAKVWLSVKGLIQ